MTKKIVFLLAALLSVILLLAQSQNTDFISQAQDLYSVEKYSFAQQIYFEVYESLSIDDRQKEVALYFIGLCSKRMFNDDAKYWFEQFLREYPYSSKINSINY